ncbi:hypothetical protein L9F63_017996, partial [Diploptera punctata]
MNLTGGKSLESNIALIKNNAKIGAQVACEVEKIKILSTKKSTSGTDNHSAASTTTEESSSPPSIT